MGRENGEVKVKSPQTKLPALHIHALYIQEKTMPQKQKFEVAITRLTDNRAYIYAGCEELRGEAIFTPSFHHCDFGELTLKKIKGDRGGGNYIGVENGERYRVMKFKKLSI